MSRMISSKRPMLPWYLTKIDFINTFQVLRLFARHFQTHEPMPEDMLHRLCASKYVFAASDMQQQVFYSVLDQQYHSDNPFDGKSSSTEVVKEIQGQYYGLPYVDNTVNLKFFIIFMFVYNLFKFQAWQHRFSHLVGYGAKYYSYLISRALAWSSWSNKFMDDPLSRSSGEWLRSGLLQHGGGLPCRPLVKELLSPLTASPESLADALTNELDYHKDYLNRIRHK